MIVNYAKKIAEIALSATNMPINVEEKWQQIAPYSCEAYETGRLTPVQLKMPLKIDNRHEIAEDSILFAYIVATSPGEDINVTINLHLIMPDYSKVISKESRFVREYSVEGHTDGLYPADGVFVHMNKSRNIPLSDLLEIITGDDMLTDYLEKSKSYTIEERKYTTKTVKKYNIFAFMAVIATFVLGVMAAISTRWFAIPAVVSFATFGVLLKLSELGFNYTNKAEKLIETLLEYENEIARCERKTS